MKKIFFLTLICTFINFCLASTPASSRLRLPLPPRSHKPLPKVRLDNHRSNFELTNLVVFIRFADDPEIDKSFAKKVLNEINKYDIINNRGGYMNKRGFTLIELISCFVILALLGTIGIISYKSIMNKSEETYYKTMSEAINPYGDGKACQRIVDALENHGIIVCQQDFSDDSFSGINGIVARFHLLSSGL